MVWTIHISTEAPAPSWTIHPVRFIALHPRMTDLTLGMVQTLGRYKEVTAKNIMDTINDQIGTRWKRKGISPWLAGDQTTDPPGQNWTELEQPGTPQQNNFVNTKETSLACGICTILSSLCAVRNWKIDFVQQAHIRNARNWLAAVGHAIKEVVSLHRCGCGESYEQWGGGIDQPPLAPHARKPASEKQYQMRGKWRGPKELASEPSTKKGRTKGKRQKTTYHRRQDKARHHMSSSTLRPVLG